MIKKLLSLIANRAPVNQYYLELGAWLLRKGTGKKIGDSVVLSTGQTRYIANMHYDFMHNQVNFTLTNKKPK